MTDVVDRVTELNRNAPGFISLLGGELTELALDEQQVTFTFTVPLEYCHSVDIVQGGFVTAMLDAAMSHAVFGTDGTITGLATLNISTQYLGICRGNQPLRVSGWIKNSFSLSEFQYPRIPSNTDAPYLTAGENTCTLA